VSDLPPLLRAHLDLINDVREIQGPEAHPRILEWFAHTTLDTDSDETANCSAAMCAWHEESGIVSPRSAAARSWATWGIEVHGWQNVRPGDVMVEWRGHPDSWKGHVSMICDWPVHSMTQTCIGANQRERGFDRVCIKERLTDKVLSYRRAAG